MDRQQVRENRDAWQRLAHSFNLTRTKPWDAVGEFLRGVPAGCRVLDAGCGNGRHARLVREAGQRLVGLDLSRPLLVLARTNVRDPDAGWVEGVLERLPFRDASFDAVLAIAVLHHVRGHHNRILVLQDLLRIVKPEGKVLLSVWSRDQPRFGPGKEPRAPSDGRPTEAGDAMVDWTQHGLDVARYMHLYTWTEWHRELDAANLTIERVWPEAIMTENEADNFFAVIRRRAPRKTDANIKTGAERR